MSEEHEPLWKKNLANGRVKGEAKRRANASVKEALMNAFDKLGNEAFFLQLGNGGPEDRRCLAMILAKLVPLEVAGSFDHTLTVKIVKQVGEREVLIGNRSAIGGISRDAVTGKALPVVPHRDRGPTSPLPEILAEAIEDRNG